MFGGGKDVMDILTTMGHSGTFNDDVLSMAGGVAAFKMLTSEVLERLNRLGDGLRLGIEKVLEVAGGRITVTGMGSVMSFHFPGRRDEGEVGIVRGCSLSI